LIKAVIDLASIDFETRVLDLGVFLFNGRFFFLSILINKTTPVVFFVSRLDLT
jgi:hypothetical protein